MKSVVTLLMLAGCVGASAQFSRWSLGNPRLNLDLPADPQARVVAWDEPGAFAFSVSNWGAESANAKFGVVLRYDSLEGAKSWVAKRFNASWSGERTGKLSGYPAIQGQIGGRPALLIDQGTRTWVVVAEPKSGTAEAETRRVFESITVDKYGPQKWTRRAVSGRISAMLPYELSPDREGGLGSSNEMNANFGGFRVQVDVQRPDAGSKIDVPKSLDSMIAERKGMPNVSEFKSSKRRVKVGKAEGDLLEMTFKQGSRKGKLTYVIVLDGGVAHRIEVGGDDGNPQHDEWANQILGSMEMRDVSYAGYVPRTYENGGISMDLPSELKMKEGVGRDYDLFNGTISVFMRVTDTPGVGITPDGVADISEIKVKGTKDLSDYKSERTPLTVDFLDAHLVKASYKVKSMEMVQHTLIIAAPDRAYNIEVLAPKAQAELIDRVIQSIEVRPTLPSWRNLPIGQTGLTAVIPGPIEFKANDSLDPWMENSQIGYTDWGGTLAFAFDAEVKPGSTAPQPGAVAAPFLEGLLQGIGVTGRAVEVSPAPGGLSGVYQKLALQANGNSRPGDLLSLRVGNRVVILVLMYDPARREARQARHAFFSTLRNSLTRN